MIGKREILAIAQQTPLTPHVVEKDYVLGWMLASIFGHKNSEHSRNGHAHVISMMSYISTEIPKHVWNRNASWKSCARSVNSRASAFRA